MKRDLSVGLHALTARLDRAADRILRAEHDMSCRRFMALFTVGASGSTTQRALAERLGGTEPSVSRMTGVLLESGLLDADTHPAGGDRRRLSLTPAGEELVARCRELLEIRLGALVGVHRVATGPRTPTDGAGTAPLASAGAYTAHMLAGAGEDIHGQSIELSSLQRHWRGS